MATNGVNGTKHLPAVQSEHAPTTTQQRGVVIASMGELLSFSETVVKSGLAPKGFGNREAVAIAIQHGLELGLAPLQSLQSIAVINGKPGIYGDAALALVEGSGLLAEIDEWFEEGGKRVDSLAKYGDDAAAVCSTLRAGRTKPRVTRFSMADAAKAGLKGKPGPWVNYPARMLQFRARGFNLRDNFADVLRGLKTVEELQDYPEQQPRKVQAEVVTATPGGGGGEEAVVYISQAQGNTLNVLVKEAHGVGVAKPAAAFMAHFGITKLSELPASKFDAAKAWLDNLIADALPKEVPA